MKEDSWVTLIVSPILALVFVIGLGWVSKLLYKLFMFGWNGL